MHVVAKEKRDEAGQWLSAWLSSEISYYGFHGRICLILGYTCLCNQHIYKLLNSSFDLSILFHGVRFYFLEIIVTLHVNAKTCQYGLGKNLRKKM